MDIVIPDEFKPLYETNEKSPVTKYPAPVLRQKAKPLENITKKIQKLADRMIYICENFSAYGLAAPQVSESIRLIVVKPDEKQVYVLINPEIYEYSKEKVFGIEGCMSFPNLTANVERSQSIKIRGLDLRAHPVSYEFQDFTARIFQHECDHLDGVLIIDRADPQEIYWHHSEE